MLTAGLPFDPAHPEESLRQIPQRKGVFALYGEQEDAEPYIGLTPDLRRRLERLLRPAKGQTKRLLLVSRIRRIAWQVTGSEFESLLVQFALLEKSYSAKALERMKLRPPAFVRFHGGNLYPRLTITNRPSLKESEWAFGPFPSRVAADRYAEELLKLFLLRRCEENLDPNPSHPGCVYSEMKMCLAPCYQGCSDARYAEEAESVRSFLATRSESKLVQIRIERDRASEELEFEAAAKFHAQLERIETVQGLAAEIIRPLSELRVVMIQTSANPDEVSVFLFQDGAWRGPAPFSTLGMRVQNEQSGSSSLFAQPMAIQAVPEGGVVFAAKDVLETRLEMALTALSETKSPPNTTVRQGHLALLARWYYRPQQKRAGEVFFQGEKKLWPLKAMLKGVGRVVAATVLKPASVSGLSEELPPAGTLEVSGN
jgi:excinuclease UvrABC nuclease subunit